jgi:hypothetical protein
MDCRFDLCRSLLRARGLPDSWRRPPVSRLSSHCRYSRQALFTAAAVRQGQGKRQCVRNSPSSLRSRSRHSRLLWRFKRIGPGHCRRDHPAILDTGVHRPNWAACRVRDDSSTCKSRRVDLLILLPDAYDIVRNWERLYSPNPDSPLDRFLGRDSSWREKLRELGDGSGPAVRRFFCSLFKEQLRNHLQYEKFGEKVIRNANGPLYRLIYASKHPRGLDFWNKAILKSHGGQKEFFFEP